MKKKCLPLVVLLAGASMFMMCSKKSSDPEQVASDEVVTSCTDLNLFSLQRDIALGAQVDSQIRSSPKDYPLLDSASNSAAYKYLYKIRDNIFDNANIDHEKDFKWRIAIIKDDATLNAFCTPGGYIFIYTGILKFLDKEDDFAGVLGHEIGHAALRHSTDAMVKESGLAVLLSILGGNKSQLATVAAKLSLLKYSRCHETQADEFSVAALRNSSYKCNGAASFFEKIVAAGEGQAKPPVFLSTHPGDEARIANINNNAKGCVGNATPSHDAEWAAFKKLLP